VLDGQARAGAALVFDLALNGGIDMAHAIWKGAISFGLVHVPVALYSASTETGIDFDWLDKRSMDPVGYKRINKRTGKEIDKENIVKGVKVESGEYVVLSDDEIKAAYPKTTQTIEIISFANAAEIPFTQLEKPYYREPIQKGEKVYALLREAMLESKVVGIARVVLHTKEYLAALIPTGPALMLNTLRWANEIRPSSDLKLPDAGSKALKEGELKMARQLIGELTAPWKPDAFSDKFTDAVHALVKTRVEKGQTEAVEPMEESAESAASNVVDLTQLLKQSLGKSKGGSAASKSTSDAAGKAPAKSASTSTSKGAARASTAKAAAAAKPAAARSVAAKSAATKPAARKRA
jgi:DNA end-binding protein Ku